MAKTVSGMMREALTPMVVHDGMIEDSPAGSLDAFVATLHDMVKSSEDRGAISPGMFSLVCDRDRTAYIVYTFDRLETAEEVTQRIRAIQAEHDRAADIDARERAEYARLHAKYGGTDET